VARQVAVVEEHLRQGEAVEGGVEGDDAVAGEVGGQQDRAGVEWTRVMPLNTAPVTWATTVAVVPDTVALQALRSPVSLANMNVAGAARWPVCTRKPAVSLNTCPVGAPLAMATVSPAFVTGPPLRPPR